MYRLTLLGFLYGVAISSTLAQAQSPLDTVTVGRYLPLAKEGIRLDTGWKYQPGDNPTWANSTLDDHQWLPVNPNRSINQLPQLPAQGIGWLRLHLPISPSWQHKPLLLQIDQFCASEIYLNGHLLHRSGVISTNPEQIKLSNDLIDQPLSVVFNSRPEQVLAIRFALWPKRQLFNGQWCPWLLHARLLSLPQLLRQQQQQTADDFLFCIGIGICLLLALLHTAFFKFNPAQSANLYFSFYTLGLALYFFSRIYIPKCPDLEVVLYLNVLLMIAVHSSYLWCLRALYALFNRRPTYLYYSLWVLLPLALAIDTFQLPRGVSQQVFALVSTVPQLLATLEQLRLIGQGIRERKRGAGLIASGFALAFLLFAGTLLQEMLQNHLQLFGTPLLLLILLSPVVSISLYLAREFALDSQQLQVKLAQVEALSAQTLAQEQEKQQLLATHNERLEQQVEVRTAELKASQAQLIQKEKLASLGELTAGIAHEIQNPLNFVNNFSEVSSELLDELEDELAKGDTNEVKMIASDLRQNLQKIHHHGGRASRIVNGMLEHARSDTGQKRATDLNALAQEYLQLAYQGLRAKDRSFGCELLTDFDTNLEPVNVVPQELGRVLLNLYTNAFYAVEQRAFLAELGYQPWVRVRTQRAAEGIKIEVLDNGTGMAEAVQAKIFQPFFTTKPTGAGTGLGLSLSYDIITKIHGGSLVVASQEGVGSSFTIYLPEAAQSSAGA